MEFSIYHSNKNIGMVCTLASNRYVCAHVFYISSKLGLAELVRYQEAFTENYYVRESTLGRWKEYKSVSILWYEKLEGTPSRPLHRKAW